MARVLVSDKLGADGLSVLDQAEGVTHDYRPGLSEAELADAIGVYEGLIIRSASKVTARVLEAAVNLKVIGRAGIGVDNVDVPAASRRGIIVMNTPTGNAVTTAEHALALLFAVARRIGRADRTMKEGKWEKSKLEGRELSGKTLGIIGLGNIGRIVADRAQGLRMNVAAYDPLITAERATELGVALVSLDELFSRADAITIHTPLTAETRSLVNDDTIAKMKKGVLLINAARGGVYDEAAVLRGLESGHVGGAGFDVYLQEPPGLTDLVKHPNAVVTPHLGASTEEAQTRVAVEIAEQVVAYLTSGTITNSVNVPSVSREMAPIVESYAVLARRMGQFMAQVEWVRPRIITLEWAGEVGALAIAPVVHAGLAGLLGKYFEETVNPVNAPLLAKDHGIEVRELRSSAHGKYTTLIKLTVQGEDDSQAVVAGTLAADRSPRIVRWGRHELDAHLQGPLLVMRNEDRPGVIGAIGTILGQNKINVSRMQMGLDPQTGEAASVWALDSALSDEVVEQIRRAPGVRYAVSATVT
ncbi:phosphoglycerate dehydrogenase [Myxococcota bacterium]